MAYSSKYGRRGAPQPSPLRSSAYPPSPDPGTSSPGAAYNALGHKRGISQTNSSPVVGSDLFNTTQPGAPGSPDAWRSALRTLPQAPTDRSSHARAQSYDARIVDDTSASPPPKMRPHSLAMSRSDSVRSPVHDRPGKPHVHFAPQTDLLDRSHLEDLQKSSTNQLRALSKYAENGSEEDFTIKSPEQAVVGLQGRRRLQRTGDKKNTGMSKFASGWQTTKWMDQQRKFLQAYEYLCHIGEAKEWIEDIIHTQIPAIVELEEALRDGVTLAEVVQALHPEKTFRIFKHQKLQFRHSDNIALFFRFLAEVELPELFRFELVDLYEKKNIPKVIYCIHALSWLLFRKGIVNFRIGNLVGQLQFENHELEAMQKGLDKAGVSMPNFSGMSASFDVEPEPEPEETEQERIERELTEHEAAVVELQAQVRGALVRNRLGENMQDIWDAEEKLITLQAMIRGDFARQIFHYRLDMRKFAVRLQGVTRGFLVRSRRKQREQHWKDREKQTVALQSAIRGALARWTVGDRYHETREAEAGVEVLQSAIRGALARNAVKQQLQQLHQAKAITALQAAIRGILARKAVQQQLQQLQQAKAITALQGAARAMLARRDMARTKQNLAAASPIWARLQSKARAQAVRTSFQQTRQIAHRESPMVVALQSVVRASRVRQDVATSLAILANEQHSIVQLQSALRGFMLRHRLYSQRKALKSLEPAILDLQALARASIHRIKTYDFLCELNEHDAQLVGFQSLIRATMLRGDIGALLGELEAEEDSIVSIQAALRGKLVRQKFAEKQRFYRQNMEKVIKIQSFVRGRQQGEAYKSLTSGKNPPVGTVKNFVHLLNDSDFDFDEELEFERLRKTVVQHVRQNETAEQYIDQLEIKIALMVKNKITADEIVKHQRHFGGQVGSLLSSSEIATKDPFDLRALNKNSRRKLEHYQELFFVLQTQPQYLARLFRIFREQGLPEKETKKMELLMLGLFGFAQKRREEYYLLKLITRSIQEEADSCGSLQDYLRGNFFWTKLLNGYLRSPRDRKYMKEVFGPLIRESIFDSDGLDLESDPMQIYRAAINNEELRTGQRSLRKPDISREEAIRDPETREAFIAHLQDLRDIADQVFTLIEETLHRMPFGIRYVAQQTYEILCARFPAEDEQSLLQVVGHWLWKAYLLPALTQPEMWGVIDRGLTPAHKRNLNEVGKVVGQVCTGRLFGGENVYLQPLNTWVAESIERVGEIWVNMINIRDAEHQFDIDEFNDLYSRTKPTLYIKMSDIFAVHHVVASELPGLCAGQDDVLKEIVRELGSAQSNENEMMGVSSNEITLQLSPKFHDVQDPDADVNSLFMETKRLILYIIRVQSGANLLEILVRPITEEDDDKWLALLDEEVLNQNPQGRIKSAYASSIMENGASTLLDISALSYAELKSAALENILALEQHGRLSRHNQYQDLLNAIALDIRTKHRRRVQRAREIEGVRATLAQLDAKATFLDDKLKSYNDYTEQAMVTLQTRKGKDNGSKNPFSKQWRHERELEASGRKPKFGSFKYSARKLAEKGVLVSWAGYPDNTWSRINITISCDQVGVYHIEGSTGSLLIPGASATVPVDDLLLAQYENNQFMTLFKGQSGSEAGLKLNVEHFLHLIYKKFYGQE